MQALINSGYWTRDWVGLGPYRIVDWVQGSYLRGQAFGEFVLGEPKIQNIIVNFVPAASALKISAKELSEMGLVDEIVPEPEGGAHADHEATAHLLESVLERNLLELLQLTPRQLTESRYAKFRRMGQFFNGGDG